MGLQNGIIINAKRQPLSTQELSRPASEGSAQGRQIKWNGKTYTAKQAKTAGIWKDFTPAQKEALSSSPTSSRASSPASGSEDPSPTESRGSSRSVSPTVSRKSSRSTSPALKGRAKKITPKELKVAQANRAMIGSFILGVLAVAAIATSIGLGVTMGNPMAAVFTGVGGAGLAMGSYLAKGYADEKYDEANPPVQRNFSSSSGRSRSWLDGGGPRGESQGMRSGH